MRLLMVGDSVAKQYADRVRELIAPDPTLDFLPIPAANDFDREGFVRLVARKGPQYDLVYISYGLDAVRRCDEGDGPAGPGVTHRALDADAYRRRLLDLYSGIYDTGTKLIFATAVPIPEGMPGIDPAELRDYNEIAEEVAYRRSAFVLDLDEYIRARQSDLQAANHYMLSEIGVETVAPLVASAMQEVLREGGDPSLPYVLVLGDSIVNQYSVHLRRALLGRANVHIGVTETCRSPDWTRNVREQVLDRERQLNCKFSLIQFNWGLHALKYLTPDDKLSTAPQGSRCCELSDYESELERLVAALRDTGDRLVWSTTTPENGSMWCLDGDAEAYNALANKVMQRNGIAINDLFEFAIRNRVPQLGDCHFTVEGSRMLAERVAEVLLGLLREDTSRART